LFSHRFFSHPFCALLAHNHYLSEAQAAALLASVQILLFLLLNFLDGHVMAHLFDLEFRILTDQSFQFLRLSFPPKGGGFLDDILNDLLG